MVNLHKLIGAATSRGLWVFIMVRPTGAVVRVMSRPHGKDEFQTELCAGRGTALEQAATAALEKLGSMEARRECA